MPPDWDALLLAYLHDPPAKALDIQGHEGRATPLAQIALSEDVTRRLLHADTRTEDMVASRIERVVPLPTAGVGGSRAVSVEADRLHVVHPLSGQARSLDLSPLKAAPAAEAETLAGVVKGLDPARARALAVWRLWREKLSERDPHWGLLPADTRLPDHTIWNHLDAAMGCRASTQQKGLALLTFSLGPVQLVIAAARTVRDLWAGSYLLAWLTFSAMRPLLEECGPAAILSPALRGNPLMDRWLYELAFDESSGSPRLLSGRIDPPEPRMMLSPCLPNRFTAFVPWGTEGQTARELAQRCEDACREAWLEVCDTVRAAFDQELRRKQVPHANGWDHLWEMQVKSFFEIRTAVLALNDCTDETLGRLLASSGKLEDRFPAAFRVRELRHRMPSGEAPGYAQDSAGQWMGQIELLGRLMAAQRALRPLPAYDPPPDAQGQWAGKCSLLGTYEQLGPAGREEANAFWDKASEVSILGTHLRNTERLCAVSLVKRFAWAAYFKDRLGLERKDLRYPDTATVAATQWLDEARIRPDEHDPWSGQWLHWTQRDQDKDSGEPSVPRDLWERIREAREKKKPPAYYAILMMDGDQLGKWLRGDKGPKVEQVLHPKLRDYFRGLANTQKGLAAVRPFGPALQAALSEALTNFALHFVPAIVKKHKGELIYAGGDDVLALLPTTTALACASELNTTYRQNWAVDGDNRERLLMGGAATVSAGLAVVHYKEDLRVALKAAREAEKQAKNTGRKALCLRVVRRSGEDSSAVVGWDQVGTLQQLVEDFMTGTSDRWAYRLRAELPTLDGLPEGAFRAEMKRLLDRVEAPSAQHRDDFRDRVLSFWCSYQRFREEEDRMAEGAKTDMVALCQSASFLARGRDQ